MSKKPLRKGKYKVLNWSEYNKALKNRGDLTIWFSEEGIEKWLEEEEKDKNLRGKRNMGMRRLKRCISLDKCSI